MPRRRKRTRDDLAGAYGRIRKPVPPPQKVEADRRRKLIEKHERRHLEDELGSGKDGLRGR